MTTPLPPPDPVSAIVALSTVVVGPTLAYYLGTYAVIILASAIGAGWSLSRRENDQKGHPVLFITLIAGTAIMVTASIAEMARLQMGWESSRWLLAPIAFTIGAIGHEWPVFLKWLAGPIMRRLFPGERNGEEHLP